MHGRTMTVDEIEHAAAAVMADAQRYGASVTAERQRVSFRALRAWRDLRAQRRRVTSYGETPNV